MALSVTDGATITLNGWTDSVSIAKSGTPWMTVGSKFTIGSSGLSSSAVTSTSLAAQTSGSDGYGTFLRLQLTTNLGTVYLTFYDGKYLFDLKWGSSISGAKCVLSYGSTQTQWFTTLYRYGWEPIANRGATGEYGDWSSTWVSGVNPMVNDRWSADAYCKDTSGMYGLPYISEQHGGVGHYIDPNIAGVGYPASYESAWAYTTSAAALTVTSGQSLAGFAVTTIGGYQGLLEYATWQGRNLAVRTVRSYAKQSYTGFTRGNNAYLGITASEDVAGAAAFTTYMKAQPAYYPHIGAVEADNDMDGVGTWWSDREGQWTPRAGMVGYPAQITADGFTPGCWLSPRMTSTDYPGAGVYLSSLAAYIWDATTSAGVTQIQRIASDVVSRGYKFIRWDAVRGDMWREYAILKVLREGLDAAGGTDVVIETQHPYNQTVADIVRANDWFNFPTGWETALKKRLKVLVCSCPYAIIDSDNVMGTASTWSTANMKSWAKIAYGAGRPWWFPHFNTANFVSLWNDSEFTGWVDDYDARPNDVPVRQITDGWDTGFSTLSTYSDGSTISYNAVSDTLTFTDAPLTITPTANWTQISTALTVTQATIGSRTTCTATLYSVYGGFLQFSGTHAARFQVSTDGVTWESSSEVPAGTSTVYLGVTPVLGDSTLTANVLVPV